MLRPGWPEQLLTAGGSVSSRVGHLCDLCVSSLDVSGASVQLTATWPQRVTIHATDGVAEGIDDLQLELGEGPGVDVTRAPGAVLENELDVAGAIRWPWFA